MKATIIRMHERWYASSKNVFSPISQESLKDFGKKLFPHIRVEGQLGTEIFIKELDSGIREVFEIEKVYAENLRLTINQIMVLLEVRRGSHTQYSIGTYKDDLDRLTAQGLIDFDREDECEYFTTEKGDEFVSHLKLAGMKFMQTFR